MVPEQLTKVSEREYRIQLSIVKICQQITSNSNIEGDNNLQEIIGNLKFQDKMIKFKLMYSSPVFHKGK